MMSSVSVSGTKKVKNADFPASLVNGSRAMCDVSNGADVPDFWLGVVASTLGSIILNLGLNLQRYAHIKLEERSQENRAHYTRNPIWLFGFAIFIIGNLGDAVGLSFTPQSVITPIGSVSLVSNLLFARLLLKEKIGLPTYGGVLLIIGGVIMIVVTSNNACTVETVDTLLRRWRQVPFLIFTAIHLSLLFPLNFYVWRQERRMRIESEGTIGCLAVWEGKRLRAAYSVLASMYATWTVLLIKSIGELFKATFRGSNQLVRWEAWMLVFAALLSAPLQLRYINAGLRHFEALFVVPVFYAFWVFGSVTVGGIYFGEFDSYVAWQYGVFVCGVLTNVVGVSVLASRSIDTRDMPATPLTPVQLPNRVYEGAPTAKVPPLPPKEQPVLTSTRTEEAEAAIPRTFLPLWCV